MKNTFDSSIVCLNYVKNIKIEDDVLSSTDRKILFKARQYFIENLNEFTDEDIQYLLTNEHFKNFTNLQAQTLITFCNSQDKSLPAFLKQWENCETNILNPYLQKIAEKDPEQLKSYFSHEKGQNIILDIFHKQKSNNAILTDLAVNHDPVNVLKSQWSPEKIVRWLDSHPEYFLKIAEKFASDSTKNHHPVIQDKVFELLILEHIKHKEYILEQDLTPTMPLAVFISTFGNYFIEKFKVLDYDFLDLLIKKPILFIEDTNLVTKKDKPVITLNLAQYTYIKHTKEWQINKAESILSHFSKDILKPIEVEINFYTSKENIFPYFFKNNSLEINFSIGLKPKFSSLSPEDQQIYTASCINLLTKEYNLSERTQQLAGLLEVVHSDMANLYFSKALNSFSPDVASLLSSHLLKFSLEQKLSENAKKPKQPKI